MKFTVTKQTMTKYTKLMIWTSESWLHASRSKLASNALQLLCIYQDQYELLLGERKKKKKTETLPQLFFFFFLNQLLTLLVSFELLTQCALGTVVLSKFYTK